jgi:SAM-dependent methyltransferase
MAMARRLEAEWLDVLPASDPRAARSRRDLARVNALMGNARIVANALRAAAPRRIADLGAGDGRFALRVLRAVGGGGEIVLVDREASVSDSTLHGFRALGWEPRVARADVFDWLEHGERTMLDAIFANLFLHHFEREPLARMLSAIARRASTFVACEPRRSAVALAGSRLLGFIGCNDVTRHDAVVSVRAGFRGEELAATWPRDARWRIEERARGPFSHAFVARTP